MVIGLKRAGWSIRQIAADTHLGASTVHRLWRRWLEQGNVAIYRNVGATRVTSARVDRRILRQAVAAPQATCTAILQHVQDTLDHSISTRTISRRLVANGLHSCRPLRRLPLTPPNRRQRLEWCRARSTWMTEWHRVVSNPAAIVERPTVGQRGIMVWGAIAYDSRSPLLRIQGTMTAQRYVDDVLRPVTLPYLQEVPNSLYQQDNAGPHTARISQQALQDVQMLPWPPYFPDLSPIEHVWDIIGHRLHALPQPRSEDELWQMVEREWRAIPQDAIRTLIDSLPRRVAACIAVRELQSQQHTEVMQVIGFEESEEEVISTSEIKEILGMSERVSQFVEKKHPEKVATGHASDLFNDTCLTNFRNILRGRKKQTSLDMFFSKRPTGPYILLEIISPNVVKINRPNQPLNKEHDTIHVNKLRPYTEGVPHIAPPTMQAHIVQSKDNDLFPFRHLSPDLFQEYQLPTKPSSSQPLLPLTPNLFTLIQVESTSSNSFSPVPHLQINHEPTQSQVRSSTLQHKWLSPQLISLIKHIGYNMKTFLIFHLILLIYTLTMPISTVPLITLIYIGIYAQKTDRLFQLQEAVFQLLTIICTLIGETVQRLFRTAPPPTS
ncbi:hypothetical protein LAZ67_3002682 [Cordylochernes scorpioides]|uniref:Transposase n=1 Tax=Cordylochernes scorpioides TaxID=51811 RepID=A0ABY6K7Z3_9ARAC|nr:hypothetical protein LAZ67_3002682 [Cordylochernes scorpioides]